jgi:hypothetical protein
MLLPSPRVPASPTPGTPRPGCLTLCPFFSEEVILAEDETDVEQRHPFDGNCSEPGLRLGDRGLGPEASRGGHSGSQPCQEHTQGPVSSGWLQEWGYCSLGGVLDLPLPLLL